MRYTDEKLQQISFPLGGIGTGSIGLAGNGSFVDWEIFNHPDKGRLSPYTFFAVRAEYPDGRSVSKVLQGDQTVNLTGQYAQALFSGFGFGPHSGSMGGFPHFKEVVFDGSFPIAALTFRDPDFPAEIKMTAFNPFIPHNADDSGLPAALFDIEIQSRKPDIRYTVVLSLNNPFQSCLNLDRSDAEMTAVSLLYAGKTPEDRDYGDLTAAVRTDGRESILQQYWYRGGWQDFVQTFWHEFTRGELSNRVYTEPGESFRDRGDVCTVGASSAASAGKPLSFSFAITWNVPNQYNYWSPCLDEQGKDILWKNYYATIFEDSAATAKYALQNWDRLFGGTRAFCDALYNSTIDPVVLEAAGATLSVLKSPTVLRLENGAFYGWEGVHEKEGSCEGTCTHVWSYAYALCFLFPELERSLRDTEFEQDVYPSGGMRFRTQLPLGRPAEESRPCLDGQMATVIKTYREWKISGDDVWLKKNWPTVKKVLEYAWSTENPDAWDRDKDGVLEGRQHHTLDMEMFGPSGWLEGMYLAALKAASEMAAYLSEPEKQAEYLTLFENGKRWMKENLFNGRYFIQKVDLKEKAYTEHFGCPEYWNDEKQQLKYQIADGCEIDQMLGQWHANLCGLGEIFEPEQKKIALQSMVQNNFKPSLREFANAWRVFALNDEGGTVMCDYPAGSEKPVIPIPYCEECMTGFEYAFAGLLISEGFMEEGLRVVHAIRDRYDGVKRNPWNEIECGSNYARAMASFALLPILSGFEFDLPTGHIGFTPRTKGDFRCFWSLGTGWGVFEQNDREATVQLSAGSLTLRSIHLSCGRHISAVYADGHPLPHTVQDGIIRFDTAAVHDSLQIIFE